MTCQESSSSRRRSARSGRRSGTSRRSTRSPARPPDDVDREVATAPAEADAVPEAELRGRRRARRQGHHREAAGHQVDRAPARGVTPPGARGRSWTTRLPALRPVLSPAGVTTLPSGTSRSSARSAMTARRSSGSGIEPERPEQAGVIEGVAARPGSTQDVGDRERDRRGGTIDQTPPAAMTRSGAGSPTDSASPRPAAPAPRERRPSAGRRRRRSRRPTGRSAARAGGRGGDAGPRRRWSSRGRGRRSRHRGRPGRGRRSARSRRRRCRARDGPAGVADARRPPS